MSKTQSQLNIICLESDAFYALIDEVVKRIKDENPIPEQEEWVDKAEAMTLLHISSDTTLQKYRDTGLIRFNPINRRTFVYSRSSIEKYLQSKIQDTF